MPAHTSDADGPAIAVRGLRKEYGAFTAVDCIDFEVATGEIVAFLGPNGAGKTTVVEILEGYRERTAGEIRVLGQDPTTAPLVWRDRIGVVLQESEMEPTLTAREVLELYAGYHFRPLGIGETLDLVGLSDKADTRTSRLSGGQRRRLDVALGLIGDPDLLFLDEPTTGFDPSARRQAWDVIEGLRRLGKTIFLTTHFMDEAERLADRIIVISRGKIVAEGHPATLGGRATRPALISFRLPPATQLPAVFADYRADESGRIRLSAPEPLKQLAILSDWADQQQVQVLDLNVRQPTLEDIYLELTGSVEIEQGDRW
jgi:ABC-2 type transport system ATP-binding protein